VKPALRWRWPRAAATLTIAVLVLVAAGAVAWRAPALVGWGAPVSAGLVVLGSLAAGGPVAAAVLRLADPGRPNRASPADPQVLHGGAWVGVLERIAVTSALLAGWPEGIAVALAVKGLGRYPELRVPAAAERFIIGTFASILWACGCAGVGLFLRT
jgi:F0F1-type ATP synthase membrane subunit c/vacuolar-type H+-ATPase subunit K